MLCSELSLRSRSLHPSSSRAWGRDRAVTMARLALSPMASNWLMALLLLLSAGEAVLSTNHKDQATESPCSQIWQSPRFVAKKRGFEVEIRCHAETSGTVSWLRKQERNDPRPLTEDRGRILKTNNGSIHTLTIRSIQYQDNGIYYCQWNCSETSSVRGCGTELRVMGFSTVAQLKRRNTLKDGIIMIQTLLIILFIIVPIFLLLDKDDSKTRIEEDHTYEGLDIDQTATYEDIVTLRTGEVKWSVGEHPGQE